MKVLFIGGTGLISTASAQLAVERGIELYLLTRGRSAATAPAGAHNLIADISEPDSVREAIKGHSFDAVVNWIAFNAGHIERDIALFQGRTAQYVFISSASVYQKPPAHYLVREDTPLGNPYWEYSRNKIAAEEALLAAVRDRGFPGVIVRPSSTYGDTQIPLAVNSWQKPWTAIRRLRAGKPLIIPGDGTSLWTVTHNTDFAKGFVGLLGNRETIGEAFHITTDEVLTWDDIFTQTAAAAGTPLRAVHIPSDFLAACLPPLEGSLKGDKAVSTVFDNGKIKRFVPDFIATTPFAAGIRRTIAWFDADPSRQVVDDALDAQWDAIISGYEQGLAIARNALQ